MISYYLTYLPVSCHFSAPPTEVLELALANILGPWAFESRRTDAIGLDQDQDYQGWGRYFQKVLKSKR